MSENGNVTPIKKAPRKRTSRKGPLTKNRLGIVITDNAKNNWTELAEKAGKRGDKVAAAYWKDLLKAVK